MNWLSFDDFKGRWQHLKDWLTTEFLTKADTITLNKSEHKVIDGKVDLGEIYGDELMSESDGMQDPSSAWAGWTRVLRTRIHRGNGGTETARIGGFSTYGTYFAPNGTEVGTILLSISGGNKSTAPWLSENGVQNFSLKINNPSDGALKEEDFILAVDRTNTQIGDLPNITYEGLSTVAWDDQTNPFTVNHNSGSRAKEYGYINVELWVRNPHGKQAFKFYFSNATFFGQTVEVDQQTISPEYVKRRIHYGKSGKSIASKTIVVEGASMGDGSQSTLPNKRILIDKSVTGTVSEMKDNPTYYYNLYKYKADNSTRTADDINTDGIPVNVCSVSSYRDATITRDDLKNYADIDSSTGKNLWTDHTPSASAPYFAVAVFDKTQYYLIKANEPAQK